MSKAFSEEEVESPAWLIHANSFEIPTKVSNPLLWWWWARKYNKMAGAVLNNTQKVICVMKQSINLEVE